MKGRIQDFTLYYKQYTNKRILHKTIVEARRASPLLFPETACRISAVFAFTTKTAVPHIGKLFPPDGFTGQNAGKDQVEHSDAVKHAAGRQLSLIHI